MSARSKWVVPLMCTLALWLPAPAWATDEQPTPPPAESETEQPAAPIPDDSETPAPETPDAAEPPVEPDAPDAPPAPEPPAPIDGVILYGEPKQLAEIKVSQLTESSGLAPSRRFKDVFWSHNDSGDAAKFYAFDITGKRRGQYRVQDAKSADWEDMASYMLDGVSYLLFADVGDNDHKRTQYDLYVLPEPEVGEEPKSIPVTRKARLHIRFRYEGGKSANCEAVAVDAAARKIILITKVLSPQAVVYELPLPTEPSDEVLEAKRIGEAAVPIVTAMDISPDGRRAIVGTYLASYEFTRAADESWAGAFARTPRELPMPMRKQGEAICYGVDGATLYLTSEHAPTPLWMVPIVKDVDWRQTPAPAPTSEPPTVTEVTPED